MSFMKPSKPDKFDGTRDALKVRAWLHSIEKYVKLIQVGQITKIDESTAIDFASTYFTDTAANWWFSLVLENKVPKTWAEFKLAIETEFVPKDSIIRARDKLYRLKQRTSVAAYLAEFRNTVIDIPGMSDSEKMARFTEGLKPHILLEVRKASPNLFEQAAKVAVDVDGAYYGAGFFFNRGMSSGFREKGPVPMEIGNFEKRGQRPGMDEQRQKDIRNNACFICHKPGCRSYKHKNGKKEKRVSWNNTEAKRSEDYDRFPSEN